MIVRLLSGHFTLCTGVCVPSFYILAGSLSDDPEFAYSDLDCEDQGETDIGVDQFYYQDIQGDIDVTSTDLGYFQD